MYPEAKKVIVVDDDIDIRNLLSEFLRLHDCKVECFNNGKDALELIKNGYYDLLITDADMPGINGIMLTKIIRDISTPLLIIGMSGTSIESEFLAAGADFFLGKPISLGRLKGMLKERFFIDNP